ncbi:hypothetical protein OFN50_29100, partial [Escherichia coli]|nr:hypothetical protein [Escherichia coli]
GVLKVDLPMGLLPRLVETPLQEVLNDLDIVKLCHVPTEYVLGGKTQAEALEADSQTDVTSENVHQETGDSEVERNTEAEEHCSEVEEGQTAPHKDVSVQAAEAV